MLEKQINKINLSSKVNKLKKDYFAILEQINDDKINNYINKIFRMNLIYLKLL